LKWQVGAELLIVPKSILLRAEFLETIEEIVQATPYMCPVPIDDLQALCEGMKQNKKWHDDCLHLARSHSCISSEEDFSSALAFDAEDTSLPMSGWGSRHWFYQQWAESLERIPKLVDRLNREWKPIEEGKGWLGRWSPSRFFTGLKLAILASPALIQLTNASRFEIIMLKQNSYRRFGTTSHPSIVWVPLAAREGDTICRFEGCHLPFVIRECEELGKYKVIGDCFLLPMARMLPSLERLDANLDDIQLVNIELV
jgi:hypothetical protein